MALVSPYLPRKMGNRIMGIILPRVAPKPRAEDRALSEAQRRANDKYIKENYKQVKLSMPNEEAEILDDYCSKKECSKAGFIRQAIKEKMEREPLEKAKET